MKVETIINSFVAGQISPRLAGRTNIDQYYQSAAEITNMIVECYGGAKKCVGTQYVTEVKNSSNQTRLIPFVFSDTQAYIIEVGDLYMRFYMNGGVITASGSPYEITTSYPSSVVRELQFAQTDDLLYIAHKDYPLGKVTRTGHAAWSISYPTLVSGPTGNPRAVTFYEQRMWIAGTDTEPQTIWGSTVGGYEDFSPGADAADGLEFTIDTNTVEVTNWLFPADEVLIGTTGGLHSLGSGSTVEPITPSNLIVKKKSTYASSKIAPVGIGNFVYYWQVYNKILREYAYSLDTDSYVSKNKTVFSENISGFDGIVEMAYQQSPNNIIWCVRDDGKLASFTRQTEQGVEAWALHETDGYYESVAVIPRTSYDEVWFVVKRYINGSWVKYVEYMVAPEYEDQEDMFFVHSGLTLDDPKDITNITVSTGPGIITITSVSHGFSNLDEVKIRGVSGTTDLNHKKYVVADAAADSFTLKDLDGDYVDGSSYGTYVSGGEVRECVDTISGLDHLEGETVQVCVDGAAHPNCVVTSGAISLLDTYSQVTVGLGYTATLKTNDIEAVPGGATSQGQLKRVSKLFVRIYQSLGFSFGVEGNTDDASFRTADMPTDQAPDLYTGIKTVQFPSGWAREKQIVIEQDQPLPLHILSIVADVEVN